MEAGDLWRALRWRDGQGHRVFGWYNRCGWRQGSTSQGEKRGIPLLRWTTLPTKWPGQPGLRITLMGAVEARQRCVEALSQHSRSLGNRRSCAGMLPVAKRQRQ